MFKEILIIGGKGYIGTYLVNYLVARKYGVDTMDIVANATYVMDMKNVSRNIIQNYDTIILLAGNSGVKSCVDIHPVFTNNVAAFIHLLSLLDSEQKFIYASSSSVYGNNFNCSEEDACVVTNYYDLSKKTIDDWALTAMKLDKKQVYGLRLGTVNGYSSNMRTDLMLNKMIHDIKTSGGYEIYAMDTTRPMLGLQDFGRAIECILSDTASRVGIYNLASFNSTVSTFFHVIKRLTGIEGNRMHSKPSTYDFSISCSKFREAFGFEFKDTCESIIVDLLALKDWTIREKNTCRICSSRQLQLIVDFKEQPLANNFSSEKKRLDTYPLKLMLCVECFHLQLSHVVNPSILYRNYIYVSGTSTTGKQYFTWMESFTRLYIQNLIEPMRKGTYTVLEIACNDGTQLGVYKEQGWGTIGVDPAENLKPLSIDKCDEILCDFWNDACASHIKTKYTHVDLILAENVFAHTDDVHAFLRDCKKVMSDNTLLVIQTSHADIILGGQCDTIYHEHLSFFSIQSMTRLLGFHGLYLYHTFITHIHGKSMVFCIGTTPRAFPQTQMARFLGNLSLTCSEPTPLLEIRTMQDEFADGLYEVETYMDYTQKCLLNASMFRKAIVSSFSNNRFIIGYGASAKGNTILNGFLTKTEVKCISFIADDNTNKQGLYTPGTGIPIKSPDILIGLSKDIPLSIIMLSWNFDAEIKNKIKRHGFRNVQYIYPFYVSCL
jgi:nucleoside-diphosphate-sugar epimerase